MAERAEDKEFEARLQALKDAGNTVYSFSRLETFNNCLYEAYRTYVLKVEGRNNPWAIAGSRLHSCLEDIVDGEATEADILPAIQMELKDMDDLGIEFPKDSQGGDSFRENWIKDIFHFAETYKSPRGKNLKTEEPFLFQTPKGRWLQGFIDLQMVSPNGSIAIFDYKTSSMYTGQDIISHGRQLITYLLGKRQQGVEVKKLAWIFLKYADIHYLGYKTSKSKEKTWIDKTIERRKIGAELSDAVSRALHENGYEEADIEFILMEFQRTNRFDALPVELRKNYIMKPCVVDYPITEEAVQECLDYIDNTIDMWELLDKSSSKDFPPRKFTKTLKSGKEVNDCFYCTSLCGHFLQCPYIKDFLDKEGVGKKDDSEDLFS